MVFKIRNKKRACWAASEKKNGIILFLEDSCFRLAAKGKGDPSDQEVYRIMEFLLETGQAETLTEENEIFLDAETASKFDEETRETLNLPYPWPGSFKVEMKSVPNRDDFDIRLSILNEKRLSCNEWALKGALLEVDGDSYLPDVSQYASIRAFVDWRDNESKNEVSHLKFIHTLSEAKDEGLRVQINGEPKIDIKLPSECVVNVEELSDGTLELTPLFTGVGDDEADFSELRKAIRERLHHLTGEAEENILRVGQKIIVLNKQQTREARQIAERKKIDPKNAPKFKKDPRKWMADNLFVHGEVDLLPRVTGIGEWVPGYLGAAGETGEIDWFNKNPDDEKPRSGGSSGGGGGGKKPDEKPDEKRSGPLVNLIERNDFELEWGIPGSTETFVDDSNLGMDFEGYPRTPFPHQKNAVRWLVGHSERAGEHRKWANNDSAWGAGALLADDMGLGKTFSTILFIGKWYEIMRKVQDKEPPACLVVAPLSLVENWKNEINESFPDESFPFLRVVMASPGADLPKYRIGMKKDEVIDGKPSYGLKFGGESDERIDKPGSIVITTYETLHNFRFSLAGCDWGVCVFDEAQYIKNPNALRTVAAKSLKGFFRIAITGTPVENHLGDLWSLTDTIEPGYLNSFKVFKSNWIDRMSAAPWESKGPDKVETKIGIGNELQNHLGSLILRRVKEEMPDLELPKKTINKTEMPMTDEQIALYEDCLSVVGGGNDKDSNSHLSCMWELRRITVHPALKGGAVAERAETEKLSRFYFSRSAKLQWLLDLLDSIREKKEKVIIFAVQRKFQDMLADHLGCIYDIKVPVINGDTKAVKTSRSNNTRLGIIKEFSETNGFAVSVLSPIAAGAGLNIVAANHVIHLERHWNPSKENQATDRVYRIGQKLPVEVHYSILTDPDKSRNLVTFDQGLDQLIDSKRKLMGSLGLIPDASGKDGEFITVVTGPNHPNGGKGVQITIEKIKELSWEHFEALIAIIYEKESERVILTKRGSDSGVDVVAIGCSGKNILIQCKQTKRDDFDSEAAVRETYGAKPLCEERLGIKMHDLFLHSTAKNFSKRTKSAAKSCGVDLFDRKWLGKKLKKHQIFYSDVLLKDLSREKIGV